MTLRIERDGAFWRPIIEAAIADLAGYDIGALAGLCECPTVMPLASERGGFFFVRLDPSGFVCELHAVYAPSARGSREIVVAAREAVNAVFIGGYQLIVTLEVRSNPRSQPPRSFGFVQAGDWRGTILGEARSWVLTRAAWELSPASRRAVAGAD